MNIKNKKIVDESIVVYTHRSKETLLKFNGSTSWKLNPKRAKKCKYIICCQNTDSHLYDPSEDQDSPQDHKNWVYRDKGEAFLIGLISNVVPSMNKGDDGRWMIEFKEYAEISLPNFWKGYRNPVIYEESENIINQIGLDDIKFKLVPERDIPYMQEYFKRENAYYSNINTNRDQSFFTGNEQNNKRLAQMEETLKKFNISIDLDGDGIVGLKEGQMQDILSASEQKEVDLIIEEFEKINKSNQGLTISEAKKGLSIKYDIPEENIEVILKG